MPRSPATWQIQYTSSLEDYKKLCIFNIIFNFNICNIKINFDIIFDITFNIIWLLEDYVWDCMYVWDRHAWLDLLAPRHTPRV